MNDGPDLKNEWSVETIYDKVVFLDENEARAHQLKLNAEGTSSQLFHTYHRLVKEPVMWLPGGNFYDKL